MMVVAIIWAIKRADVESSCRSSNIPVNINISDNYSFNSESFQETIELTKFVFNMRITPLHRCKRGTPLLCCAKEGKRSCSEFWPVFQIRIGMQPFSSTIEEEYTAKLWEVVDTSFFHWHEVRNPFFRR